MKARDLRNLSQEELLQKEKALLEELSSMNKQRYAGRVEKPHKFSLCRKDLARIKTIINAAGKNTSGEAVISNGINNRKDK